MFRNLFAPDSHLMVFMGKLTDCIFLSLFFVVCCFGVVTTGASIAALYDATFRSFRQKERHSWSRFSEVFRTNWKAGIRISTGWVTAVSPLAASLSSC